MKYFALLAAITAVLTGIELNVPCPYWAQIVSVPVPQRMTPRPLEGPFAPNAILSAAQQLWQGAKHAETVAFGPDGSAYLAVESGHVLASSVAKHQQLSKLAHTGGRPLGIAMHPDGYLVVCDAVKGLLAVDIPSATVRLLTSGVTEGNVTQAAARVSFCDDVAVASSGQIYFTDASELAPQREENGEFDVLAASKANLLEGRPSGRVLVYDPSSRTTAVVAEGIWFANGVALAGDESFLVVAETFGCRLKRHWLKGPKAGTTEVFVDSLPGFVDGVSSSPDGSSFWAAIVSQATPPVLLMPRSRLLRWVAARLPKALQPQLQPYGLVVEIAADGTVLRSLHDPSGRVCPSISSITQVGFHLFLGNLGSSWVCSLDLSKV